MQAEQKLADLRSLGNRKLADIPPMGFFVLGSVVYMHTLPGELVLESPTGKPAIGSLEIIPLETEVKQVTGKLEIEEEG